jgi:hydroxymethylglutaryl-CoA reductase (NADPH)
MLDDSIIVQKLVKGELKLHQIDLPAARAVELRTTAIEKLTGTSLDELRNYTIDPEPVSQRNIENMIGAVQVPVGIAGPLRVNGEYARGDFYIPLATTEGALVASASRGCKAVTSSGGATVRILKDEMTRAPVFRVQGIVEARRVIEWLSTSKNFDNLRAAVKETTKHGELLRIDPYVVGDSIYLRCAFDTKDALGMNMVTIATDRLADNIQEALNITMVALSGNMCVDKKPAAINLIEGRGKSVVAEAILPRSIVEEELKTTPEMMNEVHYRKNIMGSIKAGALGFNAHAANIVAAIFIATGQDAAHVVEGANAITSFQMRGEEVYASVTMPSLPVGTVGGGTRVEPQKECLSILGVAGGGDPPGANAKKFAELICSAVLAGEISLVAALAARHLARAHATLGR